MYFFFYPALAHQFKTKARGHVDPHQSPLDTEASQNVATVGLKLVKSWESKGTPQMPRLPQEIAGLMNRDYEPLLSLNKAEK